MRRRFALAALASTLFATNAMAQDKAACLEASAKAQDLRDAHKLLATRDQLQICAADACPNVVREDCKTWLDEVDRAIPTVTITAKDDAGAPLVNVKVVIDGKVATSRLGGTIEVDPGKHHFHFEGAGGGVWNQDLIVGQGEKGKPIAIVLTRPTASAGEQPPPDDDETPPDTSLRGSSSGSGLRTAGFVVGGVGVGGLLLGGIFGILAIDAKSSANCDAAGFCDADPLDRAKAMALGSTVSLIVGGALLATGLTLVLVAPRTPKAEASLQLGPWGTTRGAGLSLSGSF
jgi:hypothetical protein